MTEPNYYETECKIAKILEFLEENELNEEVEYVIKEEQLEELRELVEQYTNEVEETVGEYKEELAAICAIVEDIYQNTRTGKLDVDSLKELFDVVLGRIL